MKEDIMQRYASVEATVEDMQLSKSSETLLNYVRNYRVENGTMRDVQRRQREEKVIGTSTLETEKGVGS